MVSPSLTCSVWERSSQRTSRMGCGGFVCSKNALCALNVLYVVSPKSTSFLVLLFSRGPLFWFINSLGLFAVGISALCVCLFKEFLLYVFSKVLFVFNFAYLFVVTENRWKTQFCSIVTIIIIVRNHQECNITHNFKFLLDFVLILGHLILGNCNGLLHRLVFIQNWNK